MCGTGRASATHSFDVRCWPTARQFAKFTVRYAAIQRRRMFGQIVNIATLEKSQDGRQRSHAWYPHTDLKVDEVRLTVVADNDVFPLVQIHLGGPPRSCISWITLVSVTKN
jgi:hypothetical protein